MVDDFDLSQFDSYREDNRLEVKKAKGGLPQSLWESYSALANTNGGVIVCGAGERPDGSWYAAGLTDAAKLKKELWDAANNPKKVSANLLREADVADYEVEGNAVLVVRVPRAPRELRPVYINGDLMGGAYKRNWEGDYRCSPREVRAMLREQTDDTPDTRLPEAEAERLSDLDAGSVRAYRMRYDARHEGSAWTSIPDDEFLERIGAARRDGSGELRPTRAGLLMFGQEWRILYEYPDYFLDYREHLDPSVRWTDRIESQSGDWSGNVFDFFVRVSAKLLVDLKKPFRTDGVYRIDETPLHEAVREALANCLVNADYLQPWSVVVEKWPDRITLANPGTIIAGREQMLKGGVSQPRNRGLFKMFNLIGVGEHAGSGVPDILAAWEAAGLDAPTVEEQFGPNAPDRTTVTLPLASASLGTSMVTNMTTSGQAGGHADRLQEALEYCTEPRTRDEIREHLGIQSKRYVREQIIQPLLVDGRLVQTIPDKPRSPNQRYVRAQQAL